MQWSWMKENAMKTALITGATSGIGEEFARRLARMGYRLILTGRREDRLEKLAMEVGAYTRTIVADLSNEEACKQFLNEIADETIDVFINNAGFGTCGKFTETSLEKEISMIHVNDIAMHILFKGVLQKMVKRDRGRILNVASSAGLLPGGPYMATYYASKAYVVSLTRAVAHELEEMGSNVYVGALCPGPVDTEFNQNADVAFALKGIRASDCVQDAIRGMRERKIIIVPSVGMRLAMLGAGMLPKRLQIQMTAKQQKKKIYE